MIHSTYCFLNANLTTLIFLFYHSCNKYIKVPAQKRAYTFIKNITNLTYFEHVGLKYILLVELNGQKTRKRLESTSQTCYELWRKFSRLLYTLLHDDKSLFCFFPNIAYTYFSVLCFLTIASMSFNLSLLVHLFSLRQTFSIQIWVLKRGRGRSPNTSASPCTLLASALMDAAMSIGSCGSCIKATTCN